MKQNGHNQATNKMVGLFYSDQEDNPGAQHWQGQVKQGLLSPSFPKFSTK